jgi:prepilin-type N-terminal cleavage/methylation domain-containing protein
MSYRNCFSRKGLTLLELVVVLVILVALAGILVPLLPGMLGRAHTAEHATNVSEINKAVEAFNMINRGYPDNLDQLTAYAVMPGANAGATNACGGELVDVTLTADTLAALNAAGLNHVYTLDTTDPNLVQAPYTGAAAALTATSKVAGLSETAAGRLYNDATAGTYVVFGFGPGCEMIGKPGGIPESPLHFGDGRGASGDPTRTYARFGLVFRVTDTAGAALRTAQFVGAVALHEAAVTNANDAAAEYHLQNPQ